MFIICTYVQKLIIFFIISANLQKIKRHKIFIFSNLFFSTVFQFIYLSFSFHSTGLAALANMKHEEDMRMSVSPPSINQQDAALMYARLFSSGQSAMRMLTPQLFAANRNAALMAAQLPMSMRAQLASATNYFPHHPALFGSWPPSTNTTSPPISPISPALSVKSVKKINNNNNIVSTTTDILPKKVTKPKKITVKKEPMTPPISIPMDIPMQHDMVSPTGPISPPTSGSSPDTGNNVSLEHHSPILPTSTKDPTREKVFTCKICSRSFGYKHVLQNHERTHTGEKPFECPECHKRFTRDHHLKTHMRLHTGEKPYHCSHCDRHFVQVANLRRHLRVHTGERPYTCEMCKNKFSDSNQLKAHMLIHNGEKPFQCDRCNTNFRRRHHLMHHKCGTPNLPTPAMSPAMSLFDNKSASSRSDVSDVSLDLSKSSSLHQYLNPLELTEEAVDSLEKRNRKSHDVRRILRMPPTPTIPTIFLPEQTEPEDLSMHSPRSNVSNDDEDFDDLDDAASLYLRQRNTPHKSETTSL